MREGDAKGEYGVTAVGGRVAVALLTLLLIAGGCRSDMVFSDSMRIEGGRWSRYEPGLFEVAVKDTLSAHDMLIMLRTGSEYPFRNIYLFVTTIAPGGERVTDTVGYMLADDRGNRLGSGFGDIRYHELPFRTNIYFPQAGTYRFRVEHAMRREDLEGVYDVGVKIVRQKEGRR